MDKYRILVDLDNTGVDLVSEWIRVFNERHGTNLQLGDITDWDVSKFVDPGKRQDLWDILELPGLYRGLKPYPGFVEALKTLYYDGIYEIIIATATQVPQAAKEKMEWIFDHLPFLGQKNVVITHKKHMLRADAMVDDGPHNIIDFKNANPRALTVCIGYPYNSHAVGYSDLYIQNGWKDMADTWKTIVDYFRRANWC